MVNDKKHPAAILLCCFSALAAAAFMGIAFGAVSLSPKEVLDGIMDGEATANGRIIYCVRLPRVLGGFLAGAALAVSGAVIQAVLGNPLASPNIIGVNAGAGFAVVLSLAIFPTTFGVRSLAAFIGALAAVMLVYFIARKTGASKITLVLAGVAFSSLFNAGTDTVTTFVPDTLSGLSDFRIGGLEGISLGVLSPAWVLIIAGIAAIILLGHDIDVLALGDSTAFTLGMNVKLLRFVLLTLAALLAGAAVSFSGLLGFIGLIIPHIAEKLTGSSHTLKIPVCALMGAVFTSMCDLLARTLFAPHEIALGIVVSYIGVPFFIYLLLRKKGGKHGA